MAIASSGQVKVFDISPRAEFLLALGAVVALALGAWGLFGTPPAPAPAVQSAALSSSPMPKLDHADAADPTAAFITANALSHVATLKLPPGVTLWPKDAKPRVQTARAHVAHDRPVLVPVVLKAVPPRRIAASPQPAAVAAQPLHIPAVPPAAPTAGFRLPLVDHLSDMVPTPERLRRSVDWVGDAVGSLASRL